MPRQTLRVQVRAVRSAQLKRGSSAPHQGQRQCPLRRQVSVLSSAQPRRLLSQQSWCGHMRARGQGSVGAT
eukprot:10465691-Lingulodinium_polyedra.AAC.1